MTHISSIGAGLFTDLSISAPATELSAAQVASVQTESTFTAGFANAIAAVGGTKAAGTFIRIANIREFPAFGTPANIVNVPRYGAKTSGQIQGQSDNPAMEITLNYVASDWAKGAGQLLGNMVGDSQVRMFRVAMLNTEPRTGYASTPGGLGTIENTVFYFLGKLEAIQYSPQLGDANQATLTISMLTDLAGGFTLNPA